jgi:hypothetical protein
MGEGIDVTRVTIFNIVDIHYIENSARLSNSVVSLINCQGHALKTYTIGDARDVEVFDINFAGEGGVLITNSPTPVPTNIPTGIPTFDATLVWSVRVQLEGRDYLHLREVEVFDLNGVNRALNKPTSQSSDMLFDVHGPSSQAVDGILDTFSHTDIDNGKYCSSSAVIFSLFINFNTSDFVCVCLASPQMPGGRCT